MSVANRRKNAAKGNLSKWIVSTGLVLCLAMSVVMLYPALQNYYIAYRVNEQLLQEHAAVEDRNSHIRSQIAYLNTPEGISDRARERFGWTPHGEQAVNITGLAISESSTVLPQAVPNGSGELTETWWIKFLDVFFAIEEAPVPDPIPDPFIP